MENDQVEILSPIQTNGPTVDQGTAEVTATSGTAAELTQIGRSINTDPSSTNQLFTSDLVYIFSSITTLENNLSLQNVVL
jgi:hypothetical protein